MSGYAPDPQRPVLCGIVLLKQGVVLLQEWYKYWLEHLISVPQCSQISSENNQEMQGCCMMHAGIQGASNSVSFSQLWHQ